jgi:hypothetical protein
VFDPISLLVGAGLLGAGFGAGRLRRRPAPPPPPPRRWVGKASEVMS